MPINRIDSIGGVPEDSIEKMAQICDEAINTLVERIREEFDLDDSMVITLLGVKFQESGEINPLTTVAYAPEAREAAKQFANSIARGLNMIEKGDEGQPWWN